MSLFHVQEWYQTHVEEGRCMTNAQLIGNRGELFPQFIMPFLEQIIIGSLNGNLVIIDPGRDVENRKEVSVLIEKQLSRAVLQILVGRFLTNYKENLLAVLHPKVLSFYRLNSSKK
jgi:Bardet-Biedl syndrome 9 protein